MTARDLGQQREVRTRRFVDRRNAHQPLDPQTVTLRAEGEESVGVAREHAGLVGFFAGVDLREQAGRLALTSDLQGQAFGDTLAIDRLDHIEEGDRVGGLIGLQRPDEVEFDLRPPSRPALHGFLNAVFTEDALAGVQHRFHGGPGLLFRNRRQTHRSGIATRGPDRDVDPAPDRSKWAVHAGFH